MRTRILIRGWFLPSITGYRYTEGGLFDSAEAFPITTVNLWDADGHWSRYGALYAHVTTEASVGPRSVTLHGLLVCASHRFWTDRDPLPPPPVHPVYGTTRAPGGALTTWATAGGVKLTMTVPQMAYPRNALAQVTVGIQNVSHHTVGYLAPGISPPGVSAPQPEVLDHAGRIVFPPAMPYVPAWPGPAPVVVPLRPGKGFQAQMYVVVRGARLRASVTFNPAWTRTGGTAPDTLRTHPISVRLTSEPAPKLTLDTTSSGPVVDVTRPAGMTGLPLEISLAGCPEPSQPAQARYVSIWSLTPLRVIPGCAPVQSWHLRVAWLNHPVAALDYTAPQPTPTAGPSVTPTPVPTRTPIPTPTSGPSFDDLLHHAARAEGSVHTLHTTGRRMSIDLSAQMHVRVQADCRSSAGRGIPILARTLITGQQTQAGRIDRGYIVQGPVLPAPHGTVRAWYRSPAGHGRWRTTDLRRQWRLDRSLPDPIWSPDPAYLNQVCPDLLRLTYLSAPLVGAQHKVLGTTRVNGHRVWHLREHLYFNLDLYVDTRSFVLRRLVLGNRAGSSGGWQVRTDYSRLNTPIHVPVPG